jgi:5-aminopentanamidase
MSDIDEPPIAASSLRIAIGQFGSGLGDVAGNLARLREMLGDAARAGVSLACFPELSLSGYLLDAERYDTALLDEVEAACATLAGDAARLGVDVVYGAPLRNEAGALVNAVVRERAGAGDGRLVYAKTHMDVRERRVFTTGTGFTPDPAGVFGLGCCYDLAFPEAIRSIVLAGSRVVLVPMAWEVARGFVMRRVVAARAVENVAYVVCVNQCGSVGDLRFLGASQVVDPLGETVVELGSEPGLRVVELALGAVDALRADPDTRTYPLLADRRPELYGELAGPGWSAPSSRRE